MNKLFSAIALGLTVILGGCGDKGAEKGDKVIINFAGYIDGEQFPGGTAENFPLQLGSGQFVPGFEDQLIGAKKGETRDVKIKFPENYVPGLSGRDVVFKVTIVELQKPEKLDFSKSVASEPYPKAPGQD